MACLPFTPYIFHPIPYIFIIYIIFRWEFFFFFLSYFMEFTFSLYTKMNWEHENKNNNGVGRNLIYKYWPIRIALEFQLYLRPFCCVCFQFQRIWYRIDFANKRNRGNCTYFPAHSFSNHSGQLWQLLVEHSCRIFQSSSLSLCVCFTINKYKHRQFIVCTFCIS